MKGTFQVIRECEHPLASKMGKGNERLLSLLDVDNPDSIEPLEYILQDEELQYSGECRWKKVELAITCLRPVAGGLRILGRILSVT